MNALHFSFHFNRTSEYSNWPTFPQLYIEGDLVGGLDVMKELHENGELIEMFEGADKLKTKLKYLTKKSKVSFYNIKELAT